MIMGLKQWNLTMVLLFGIGHLMAQPIERAEATLVCNFVKHLSWPEGAKAISVGVLGNSRVLTELNNKIKREKLPLAVGKIDYMEEVLYFDIVVVPKDQHIDFKKLIATIDQSPILVVSENTDQCKLGAQICFLEEEGKLRFVINQTSSTKKGIIVGGTLLDYATDIY